MFWILLAGGTVIFLALALGVYQTLVQRRAVAVHNSAVSQTLPRQEESLALAREGIELQREANRLLAVIAKAVERQ